jgi:DNA-directed RNA polymerase specialized sigma24 family protein
MIERWAEWGRAAVPGAWPEITLLGRVIKQGFTGAAQHGPVPEMGEEIYAVERAVLSLRPLERRVVVTHYMHWQPKEVSARFCQMSSGQFDRLLHRARRRVADHIGGYFSRENWHVKQRA